ncbi:hypothetical protein GCM10010269_64530 [Streptomyces humidus]|uniref:Uncharacterized protein n=1 Tax=Streptomyces humidus TaxID=52259 RepID=A0A918G2M7_9ACTN|nr:hypothetical protein GCM10010269_64530 [Streptomyces humidus]
MPGALAAGRWARKPEPQACGSSATACTRDSACGFVRGSLAGATVKGVGCAVPPPDAAADGAAEGEPDADAVAARPDAEGLGPASSPPPAPQPPTSSAAPAADAAALTGQVVLRLRVLPTLPTMPAPSASAPPLRVR